VGTTRLTPAQALAVRLERQGMSGARPTTVAGAARRSAGIQAQDLAASRLAVRVRSRGLQVADVVRACNEERSVTRTWLMRATLHLVATEDVAWLVHLLGPLVEQRYRTRRRGLGLDEALCARALKAMPDVLDGGPLTRAQLVAELARSGIDVEPGGQAPAHLIMLAAATGVLCRGPDDGSEPTYVALPEPPPGNGPEGAAAEAELARRYFDAFSPATTADFAAWSGLALGRARAAVSALAGELRPVTVAGIELWVRGDLPDTASAAGAWRLLPAFDSYLLGYRDRDLMLDPAFARRIQAGGGWLHPVVVHDGRVVGRWRLRRDRPQWSVDVEPFTPEAISTRTARAALTEEGTGIARFLDRELTLTLPDSRLL
jgi:hypothetical protein